MRRLRGSTHTNAAKDGDCDEGYGFAVDLWSVGCILAEWLMQANRALQVRKTPS
jgi:hypothetical protein